MLAYWQHVDEEGIKNLLYEMIYLKTWGIEDPELFSDVIKFATKHYGTTYETEESRKEMDSLLDRMDDAWKDMYYG